MTSGHPSGGQAATLLSRAHAAALTAGWVHASIQIGQNHTILRIADVSGPSTGSQVVQVAAAYAQVRVTGAATYVTGNVEGLTTFVHLPVKHASIGKWFVLHPGDPGYSDISNGIRLSQVMNQVGLSGPYTVVTGRRHGHRVIGIEGAPTTNAVSKTSQATLWVAASGPPLPVEFDLSALGASMTVRFTHWGQPALIRAPRHARPVPTG